MAERIMVTVKGPLGVDDADLLLTELRRETRLGWYREDRADDKHLIGGPLDLVLVAVASKSVEMAYEQAFDKAREVIEHWRKRHLDPPDASVETASADDPDSSGESGSAGDAEPEG
jgi:hypothetical protein